MVVPEARKSAGREAGPRRRGRREAAFGQAHVVELYISYLRKKIDSGRPPLIHTVRGVGYVLKPPSQ